MENKNLISVVLPIKTSSAHDFEDFFEKALKSVKNQNEFVKELIIVHGDDNNTLEMLESFDYEGLEVKFEKWSSEPSFAKQVNHGVSLASSEWVSILEFDDEFSNIWFKNASKYIDIYKEVEAFLPIVIDVDDKAVFVGFTNEASFAANISSEIGILTNETLQNFQNFQIAGMVFKKDTFEKLGGLKSNLKLTFGYELFLRLTHNGVKIMTIPKVGYKHVNLRTGSIFWNYKYGENPITEDEARFWIDTAKKEYFFTVEREINYEPQEI